jgi:hypothetical protein
MHKLSLTAVRKRPKNDQVHKWRYDAPRSSFTLSRISRSVGKRPSFFLEKMTFPSTETTKMPPLPRTISLSMANSRLISAARLEALGR